MTNKEKLNQVIETLRELNGLYVNGCPFGEDISLELAAINNDFTDLCDNNHAQWTDDWVGSGGDAEWSC